MFWMFKTIRDWLFRIQDYETVLSEKDRLLTENFSLSDSLEECKLRLPVVVDVFDSAYWNARWRRTTIWYPAPRKKILTEYLSYRKIEGITSIANEIKFTTVDETVLSCLIWLNSQFDAGIFEYVSDRGEVWQSPEETLERKKGDCDDFGILVYYVIREVFKLNGLWEQNKHRLKCVDGHVFIDRRIKIYVGRHLYLNWLGSDSEWYTVESTYQRSLAIQHFLKKPQRLNFNYGMINYTFNEEFMWSQESILLTLPDYEKREE